MINNNPGTGRQCSIEGEQDLDSRWFGDECVKKQKGTVQFMFKKLMVLDTQTKASNLTQYAKL